VAAASSTAWARAEAEPETEPAGTEASAETGPERPFMTGASGVVAADMVAEFALKSAGLPATFV
jgi:hypothetical protein